MKAEQFSQCKFQLGSREIMLEQKADAQII